MATYHRRSRDVTKLRFSYDMNTSKHELFHCCVSVWCVRRVFIWSTKNIEAASIQPFIICMTRWQDQRKCMDWLWTLFWDLLSDSVLKVQSHCVTPDCLLVTQSSKTDLSRLMIWPCQIWCNQDQNTVCASQLIKVFVCKTQHNIHLHWS